MIIGDAPTCCGKWMELKAIRHTIGGSDYGVFQCKKCGKLYEKI